MSDKRIYPKSYVITPSAKTLRNKLKAVARSRGLSTEALVWYCQDLVKKPYYQQSEQFLNMHIESLHRFTDAQIDIIKDAHKDLS